MVGRCTWTFHVHPCEVRELRHTIQRQDRQIEPDEYHPIFRGLIPDRVLPLWRGGVPADIDEQLTERSVTSKNLTDFSSLSGFILYMTKSTKQKTFVI